MCAKNRQFIFKKPSARGLLVLLLKKSNKFATMKVLTFRWFHLVSIQNLFVVASGQSMIQILISIFVFIGLSLGAAQGKIHLSTGDAFSGDVDLPVLKVFSTEAKRYVRIKPEEVAVIRTSVLQERMVQAWVFVEESSREKIRFPDWYPLREYRTDVYLKNGRVVTGSVTSTAFFVFGEEEDRRFFLRSRHKGRKGEGLESLHYVDEVFFSEPPSRLDMVELAGRIPAMEMMLLVREGGAAAVRALVRKGGAYQARGLVPGRYSLLCYGAERFVISPLGEKTKPELERAVRSAVEKSREFFTEKKVFAVGGNKRVTVLVGLLRRGKTSFGDQLFVRYELWTFECSSGRWEIRKRIYLFRERKAPSAKHTWPRVFQLPAPQGVDLKGEKSDNPRQVPFSEKIAELFGRSRRETGRKILKLFLCEPLGMQYRADLVENSM